MIERESQLIRAFPKETGEYILTPDRSSETFYKKEIIKSLGGRWDGRHWVVFEEVLNKIGAYKMVRAIRESFCHTPEMEIFVTEGELNAGWTRGWEFCSYCDSRWSQPIKLRSK